jgi:hypothetical protein
MKPKKFIAPQWKQKLPMPSAAHHQVNWIASDDPVVVVVPKP